LFELKTDEDVFVLFSCEASDVVMLEKGRSLSVLIYTTRSVELRDIACIVPQDRRQGLSVPLSPGPIARRPKSLSACAGSSDGYFSVTVASRGAIIFGRRNPLTS
jgi:hypothetical protein